MIGSLKYKISNANKFTWTSISLMVVAFLDLVDRTWKGKSCFVDLLIATI